MTTISNTTKQVRVGTDRATSLRVLLLDDTPGGVEVTITAGRSLIGIELDRADAAAVESWLHAVVGEGRGSGLDRLVAQVRAAGAALDDAVAAASTGNHLSDGHHVHTAGVCTAETGCQLYRRWAAAQDVFARASSQLVTFARDTEPAEGLS